MPGIQLPHKLHNDKYSILTTNARFIVLIGGRGSAKSESVARVLLMKAQTERADILAGREFQISIEDSVHKLLKGLIYDLNIDGFTVTDKKIDCDAGGCFRFKGFARNSSAVKSAQGFKYSWIEEAQTLSQASIDDLLPTIRENDSKLFFTANPQSSEDPFSKRFIVPFLEDLQKYGYYEDTMHLIIFMNYVDNPWHGELESQRVWDYENMTRAKYDWIWLGAFNDSVEDALILAEWFDACVGAHEKLGFTPTGAKIAAHDPSDIGPDSKGYAMRHGSVILSVEERIIGTVNDGCDWATGLAISQGVDSFTWDCDGMGVSLSRQVSHAFEGKHTKIAMFKGSESPDFPDQIFEPAQKAQIQNQKKNKDALRNKRAQYYHELRKRVYNTYLAVEKSQYISPEKLISFDKSVKILSKLRAELCRMPIKPNSNGKFEMYTKEEMKNKFKFASPNLADALMMTMRQPHLTNNQFVMPTPMRAMR